jgi:hypothetical protein
MGRLFLFFNHRLPDKIFRGYSRGFIEGPAGRYKVSNHGGHKGRGEQLLAFLFCISQGVSLLCDACINTLSQYTESDG